MKLRGNNIYVYDELRNHNLNGDFLLGDFFLDNYSNFMDNAKIENQKKAPKLYAYEARNKNNDTKAVIAFKVISTLNEYKLGTLHFISDDEVSLIEALELLLEHQILKNSMLKITAYPKNDKEAFILEHLGFVKNKIEEDNIEYKITKPIYLKGR